MEKPITILKESNSEYYTKNRLRLDDCFLGAVSSFKYYGNSMQEYYNGCILIAKQVLDINSIIWRENYVIQTKEFIIAKKSSEIR